MDKLHDLRKFLLKNVPELRRGPDRILTFVENGEIEFWPSIDLNNLTHSYKMPVKIIITDWRKSADKIVIPVIQWMQIREPGMDPKNSIGFEAEVISADTVDIMITLQLTERVVVKEVEGGFNVKHVLPPMPEQMNEGAELELTFSNENE